MIPLWLTIPCSIILLTFFFHWLFTLDIDWKIAAEVFKGLAMTAIITICVIVVVLSICQRIE